MKNLGKITARFLFSILVGFMVYGCSRNAVDPILGRWMEKDSQEFTEFISNGNFLMSYKGLKKPEIVIGKWSKTNNDSFTLQMELMGTPITEYWKDVKITGDEMTVSISGKSCAFTRIKGPR